MPPDFFLQNYNSKPWVQWEMMLNMVSRQLLHRKMHLQYVLRRLDCRPPVLQKLQRMQVPSITKYQGLKTQGMESLKDQKVLFFAPSLLQVILDPLTLLLTSLP